MSDFHFYLNNGKHQLSSVFVRAADINNAVEILQAHRVSYREDTGRNIGYSMTSYEILVLKALGEKTLGFE